MCFGWCPSPSHQGFKRKGGAFRGSDGGLGLLSLGKPAARTQTTDDRQPSSRMDIASGITVAPRFLPFAIRGCFIMTRLKTQPQTTAFDRMPGKPVWEAVA